MNQLPTYAKWVDACGGDPGHPPAEAVAFLFQAVDEYRHSLPFLQMLEALQYFRGENVSVSRKTVLRAQQVETRDESGRRHIRAATRDVVGNRIASSFLFRFVCQQNQYLLSNGVILQDRGLKKLLGTGFDQTLQQMGESALLQGVCYGFWNSDHLEMIPAAENLGTGLLPLRDEDTGLIRGAVHFRQPTPQGPMTIRLFLEEGVLAIRRRGSQWETILPLMPYVIRTSYRPLSAPIAQGISYSALPVLPLYANREGRSELTPAIRAKIDAYDNILSDFADNLDRANDVYWVLNNFGGTTEDIAVMLSEIQRIKAVANLSDGSGASATAEPRTIEVPYAARQTALKLLEKALYDDYMALDMGALTGGSLTNVAIRAAQTNLNLKTDRYEWQVFAFVQGVLRLLGHDTDGIRFQRQTLTNMTETVADIERMRPDIDRAAALRLNPYLQPEEVERLLAEEAAP